MDGTKSGPADEASLRLSRRGFFGAALGAAAVAAAGAEPAKTETAAAKPAGALPPLETSALSRLAFGATPAEPDEFSPLKGTPDKRLASYVDAQLHPESLDDKACDARLAAAKF